jgi:flagellar basal-body rod modification protein FlgD
MRITNSMMVNNMEYWLSKQLEKLNDAETIVASGQQINKPSDDPSGAAEILTDRVTISECGQYESNIEQAQTWVDTSNTTLEAVSSLLSDAEDLLSSCSSDSTSSSSSCVTELESIYDQVISYANSLYSSTYMYSGNNSTTAAFENSTTISSGTADSIVFDLAGTASSVTVEITDSDGNVVRTLTTTGTSGTNTLSWDGKDDSGNTLADGNYSFTVTATDAGGYAVASYPSYRGDTGGKEITIGKNSTVTLNNDGGEIFSDALKVLSEMLAALKDTTSGNSVSVSDYSDALDEAVSGIEAEETTLSITTSQLTNATDRLDTLTTALEGRVSDLLLADTDKAAVELTAQETAYEITVSTASSVLKMSTLKDYL